MMIDVPASRPKRLSATSTDPVIGKYTIICPTMKLNSDIC